MVDKTILKNDGVFVADDYQGLERASGRLRELADDQSQSIQRRRSTGLSGDTQSVDAVLVSGTYYDNKLDAIATNDYPSIALQNAQKYFDDDLGRNITNYLNLIQGTAQIKQLRPQVNAIGTNNNEFAVFEFYNTATTLVDDSSATRMDDQNLGDKKLGVLLHPDVYDFFETSLTGTTFSGTGNGEANIRLKKGALAETITVTATSAGPGASFDVVGSVNGSYGTITSGTGEKEFSNFFLEVTDGSVAYGIGDEFTITSVAV